MFRTPSPVIASVLAGLCCALPMMGQAPAGGATPVSTTPAQAGITEPQGEITTLHARSNLVVIDVVVSDSKQNPVHGLTKDDFTLMENGRPQQIRNFEEHTALPASETAKVAPVPKLPPGLFTNQSPAPANGPVNVLLLDYLNTPLSAQPYARKQLLEYLDKAPAGTRIAIFGLTTQLTMLQGFTSNPEVLKAALKGTKGAPQASQILANPELGGALSTTTLEDTFSSDALNADQQLANIQKFQAIKTAFEQSLRMQYTLHGFDLLARYLVGIPGRKNLIWFSASFPLSIEPQVDLADAFDSVVRNDDEVRKMDNMLTRAQIAVYPVDARGVFNDPASGVVADIGGRKLGEDAANAQMDFLQQTAQEHETMQAMAEDTGGHAFINTNNLTQAVKQAIENGSNYYTLTYTPTNSQWDGKFRAIKVKVTTPSVKLSYRNGYYADDPNDRNRLVAGTAATALARPTTMSTAMMRGGPDPTEILLKVRIRPAAEPPSDKLMPLNLANPDPKINATGPYKAYGVDVVPDRRAINCPLLADGTRRCSVEIATYVYDRDGQLIVTTTARPRARLSATTYAKMLQTGMAFHQEVSVPVKGEYYLRTAVHDLTSDRVGAVEVPVASVARLQPLDPLPVPPAPAGAAADASGAGAVAAPVADGQAVPAVVPAATPAQPAAPGSPSTTPH